MGASCNPVFQISLGMVGHRGFEPPTSCSRTASLAGSWVVRNWPLTCVRVPDCFYGDRPIHREAGQSVRNPALARRDDARQQATAVKVPGRPSPTPRSSLIVAGSQLRSWSRAETTPGIHRTAHARGERRTQVASGAQTSSSFPRFGGMGGPIRSEIPEDQSTFQRQRAGASAPKGAAFL